MMDLALQITIRTSNEAFHVAGREVTDEVADVLRGLADRVERGDTSGIIFDAHGGNCGEFREVHVL